jgi:hypothetical protein
VYETVPAFEDTWIECLGDLCLYRLTIKDIHDNVEWANLSRSWYSKAVDKTPYIGRLYHRLATSATPNSPEQLFYHCKSLGVTNPFHPARESISAFFLPIFSTENVTPESSLANTRFIQLHDINITKVHPERDSETLSDYLDVLDKHIRDRQSEWKVRHKHCLYANGHLELTDYA